MTTEYNKIHALAQARRKVINAFSTDLLYFWPLGDPGGFIRDLLRQHALFGRESPTYQAAGMLDYGLYTGEAGYASDLTPDKSFGGSYTSGWAEYTYKPVACQNLPAGVYRGVHIQNFYTHDSGTYVIDVYIAPKELSASEFASQAIAHAQYSQYWGRYTYHGFDVDFDTPISVTSDEYWVYITWNLEAALRWFNADPPYETVYWDGNQWTYPSGKRIGYITALGQSSALQWPSMSKLTIGALVDASDYEAVNGAVFTLANASEELVKLSIDADRKARGYIKDVGGGTHTLTASKALHPGFNLLTLSYDKGVANTGIKLGVNGQIEDAATAPSQDLLNATLAVCIGAKQLTDATVSEHLKNAVIDDVFVAKGVLTDSDLWDIFLAYITAAPLMQTTSV